MLKVMGDRLQHLHAHDAIPKLLYSLRTSPCFASSELATYDNVLRATTSSVTNTHLGGNRIHPGPRLPSQWSMVAWEFGAQRSLHLLLSWLLQLPPTILFTKFYQTACVIAPNTLSWTCLLAASNMESGAWLNTLPVSSLGLRMDDDTILVAVGLRLAIPLCHPHHCSLCGAEVDNLATHGLSCRRSEGRHPRHSALNDIIHRFLSTAHIPSCREPTGMYCSDGKCPDGISLEPWKQGKVLVWDATRPDTFAPSHLPSAAMSSGTVAQQEERAQRPSNCSRAKRAKYAHLDASHHFVPVAVETSGVLGPEALQLFRDLGHRLREATREQRSYQFLLQRVSVAVQRGNMAAVVGSLRRSLDLGLEGIWQSMNTSTFTITSFCT